MTNVFESDEAKIEAIKEGIKRLTTPLPNGILSPAVMFTDDDNNTISIQVNLEDGTGFMLIIAGDAENDADHMEVPFKINQDGSVELVQK